MTKNTETLIDISKEVGLEVNAEKTKYMLLSHHQKAGQNHDMKIVNRCFENVAQFKYLGVTVTSQNLIQKEIKRRLNSGSACSHLVQNLSSSCLLFENIKIRTYKTIILHLVLYGCETCSLTLGEEHSQRVHNEELHNLYTLPSIIRMIKSESMRWAGRIVQMREKRNAYRLLVGKLEGKRPLGRPRPKCVWIILKWILER
jgi:hypothetical protein